MRVDRERLRRTFADPALGWITERLRRRLERGRGLRGTISRPRPTAAERAAGDRLLGRAPSRGASLVVKLAELERILRHAELAPSLLAAVEALVGPVVDQRARKARLDAEWDELFASFAGADPRPEVGAWLAARRTRRLTRRFTDHHPERGRALLAAAFEVLARLPGRGLPLAELAVDVTGDSHALDAGQPLGTLVVAAAAELGGADDWHGAQARRDVWAGVGVLLDELSAPVLTVNLQGDGESLTGRLLNLHAEAGEPCRLSVRQLLRHPPRFAPLPTVHVCENPAVVAAVANRLGPRSAPLVCIEGQPKTAARLLLDRLAESGTPIAYHGDFDWAGLSIANLIFERHGAAPWRFTAADYRQTTGGTALSGRPVAAVWDGELAPAMREAGRAVHEEQVIEELLADLQSGG